MCSLCASWLSDAPARGGAAEGVLANAADDRPTAVREQIPADSPTNRLLIADRDVRVIDSNGELIRELTLDPGRIYQPLGSR
jgi:hypothetical protein